MRTVTFSTDQVADIVNNQLVATYSNTQGDPSAGSSFSHAPGESPGPCGRGAGRQNVQTIFMTPSGEIFHVATGFLSPEDLLTETRFAIRLFDSLDWKNPTKAATQLVSQQTKRLRDIGFSTRDLQNDHPLQNIMLSGPNPSDFGMKLPSNHLFGNVSRQRMLQDGKYILKHPFVSKQRFEQNPGELVGHHKSFFGSNAAMNMLNSFGQ